MLEGEGLEDEEAPERRGFKVGVELHSGAINTTNVNRDRGRERKAIRKVLSNINNIKYIEKNVCMHGKCMNM